MAGKTFGFVEHVRYAARDRPDIAQRTERPFRKGEVASSSLAIGLGKGTPGCDTALRAFSATSNHGRSGFLSSGGWVAGISTQTFLVQVFVMFSLVGDHLCVEASGGTRPDVIGHDQ
jgi:hypothetical protein